MALPSRGGPTTAATPAALVFVAGGGGRALATADVRAVIGGGGGDVSVAAVLRHGSGHLVQVGERESWGEAGFQEACWPESLTPHPPRQLSLPSNYTGPVTINVAATSGLTPLPLALTFWAGGRPPVAVAAALPAAVW